MPAPFPLTPGRRAGWLRLFQRRLQEIYEIEVSHDVAEFLITNRADADALRTGRAEARTQETLFVRQGAEGLDLSLYVDASVLDGLGRLGARTAAPLDRLNDVCLALEGVSHFLYVIWHAQHARAVTPLEMELQAEVDKYVVVREWIERGGGSADGLQRQLFKRVRMRDDLDAAERQRYVAANRSAASYCSRLAACFYGPRCDAPRLNELRRFYRLPVRDKFRLADRRH